MIVVSLLLILVAVTLLVLGLTGASSGLLISSIVASLLAAVTLVIGARQAAAHRRSRVDPADAFDRRASESADAESDLRRSVRAETRASDFAPSDDSPAEKKPAFAPAEAIPEPASADGEPVRADGEPVRTDGERASSGDEAASAEGEVADDEPEAQIVTPTAAVQVARLDTEVVVVDGRPRYHLADCPFLAGRESEPIGVNEAVELGFTPCGICRPVDRLVAAAVHR